jgi:hypothetical protein
MDVTRGDRAGALLRETQLGAVTRVHLECHLLEVQQDVDDVFLHAFDGGVLVQHALDLHFGDRGARHRRQQHATQRVAERVAEATLERLDDDARLARGRGLHLDDSGLQKFADCTLHSIPPLAACAATFEHAEDGASVTYLL